MEERYTITISERIDMWIRGSPIRLIAEQLRRCRVERIPMNATYLEVYHMVGGDIKDLVSGLIYAKCKGMTGEVDHVAFRQIRCKENGGGSVIEELQQLFESGIRDLGHDLDD